VSKITDIDKAAMIALRPQIDEALKELGERLGIDFRAANGNYGGNSAHFKLEMKVADPDIQEKAQREEFNRYCSLFGLEPEDFGKEFRSGLNRYKVLGFELKRRKYPIRVMDLSANKVVLLTELAVPAIRAA
jgi:hypothetical protein